MLKVLVIDDEQMHRDHAAAILRGAGFDVRTGESAREGLALLSAGKPDLIFCDAMMPEVDGFEFLDQLRADPENGKIPFVFFTAMRFKGVREEAKGRGAQEYLVKPYKAEALIGAARRLLNLPDASPD